MALTCSEYFARVKAISEKYAAATAALGAAENKEIVPLDNAEKAALDASRADYNACVAGAQSIADAHARDDAEAACAHASDARDTAIRDSYESLRAAVYKKYRVQFDALLAAQHEENEKLKSDVGASGLKPMYDSAVYGPSEWETEIRLATDTIPQDADPFFYDGLGQLLDEFKVDRCVAVMHLFLSAKDAEVTFAGDTVSFAKLAGAWKSDVKTRVIEVLNIHGIHSEGRAPSLKEVEPIRKLLARKIPFAEALPMLHLFWVSCAQERQKLKEDQSHVAELLQAYADCRLDLQIALVEVKALKAEGAETTAGLISEAIEAIESALGAANVKGIPKAIEAISKAMKMKFLIDAQRLKLISVNQRLVHVSQALPEATGQANASRKTLVRCQKKSKLKKSWTGSIWMQVTRERYAASPTAYSTGALEVMSWTLLGMSGAGENDETHTLHWGRSVSRWAYRRDSKDVYRYRTREGSAEGSSDVQVSYDLGTGLSIGQPKLPATVVQATDVTYTRNIHTGEQKEVSRTYVPLDLPQIPADVQGQLLEGKTIAGSVTRANDDGTAGTTTVVWRLFATENPAP